MWECESVRLVYTPIDERSGKEPVRDWLQGLSKTDRVRIGTDIATVEFGWPVGMPTCKPLGGGLYEVRTDLKGDRISRVLFCWAEGYIVLLHGFIKKTQKTPKADLDIARARKKEVEK
ncbi:MAG: type II toxin-antitoxin system RelE/ParE family toxin [Gemmatimonadota bacterium]